MAFFALLPAGTRPRLPLVLLASSVLATHPGAVHAGGNPEEVLKPFLRHPSPGAVDPLRDVVFPFAQPRVRIAPEFPAVRKPPLLPQVVVVAESAPDPAPEPEPPPPTPAPPVEDTSTTMHFENPLVQAVEFFRKAAKVDEDPEGAAFDPTFRPAVPDAQPVSSATYEVTD